MMVNGNNKSDLSMMTLLSDTLKDNNYILQARKKYRPFLEGVGLINRISLWQEILVYMVLDGKIIFTEKPEPKS